jgi:hypothetical protein
MYKNKIDKKLDNSQFVYSTLNKDNSGIYNGSIDNRNIRYDDVSIDKKISDIFNSNDYIYKADVTIVTDNGTLNKRIVARNRNNLITMDNEYIPISIIRDIYK